MQGRCFILEEDYRQCQAGVIATILVRFYVADHRIGRDLHKTGDMTKES